MVIWDIVWSASQIESNTQREREREREREKGANLICTEWVSRKVCRYNKHMVNHVTYLSYILSRFHTLTFTRITPFTWWRLLAHGGCDRSDVDAYSSKVPDPTSSISRGPCLPCTHFVLYLTYAIDYGSLFLLFQILVRMIY